MTRTLLFLTMAALGLLAACGGNPAPDLTPGFGLGLSRETLEVAPGSSASLTLRLERRGGFGGAVTVALVSPPDGVSAAEVVVPAEASSARMTLRVAEGVAVGDYALNVRGASDDMTATAPLTLRVAEGAGEPLRVLVFTKTALYENEVTGAATAAVEGLAEKHGFIADHTEDAGAFTDENLARYDAVLFLMPSGRTLNDAQQRAFERYIRGGSGFAGVHSAAIVDWRDPFDYWPWYEGLVGAYFDDHSDVQPHVLVVEDQSHPSTAHLPARWTRTDEIYNFRTHPRDNPKLNILLSIDVSSVPGNDPANDAFRETTMGPDHPVAWFQDYDGGRSWYTSMGDTFESWQSDELFLEHILGGILYAAGR